MNNRVVVGILALLFVVACTRVDTVCVTDDMLNGDYVTFNTTIAPTRATELLFENADLISIFATDAVDGMLQSNNFADNCKYQFASQQFVPATSGDGIIYSDASYPLTYYALYPYSSDYVSSVISFTVAEDQTSSTSYFNSNLMYARSEPSDSGQVELAFDHMMSKLVINIHGDNLPIGTHEAFLDNVYRSCNVDLNTKQVSIAGSTSYIEASANGTNSFRALFPAQVILAGTEFFYFFIGEQGWLWTPTETIIFMPGVEYVYDLYLN